MPRGGRAASGSLLSVIRSSRQKYCAASRGHVGSMANVIYAETISSIVGGIDWKPCKAVLFTTTHIYYDVVLLTFSRYASLELFHFQSRRGVGSFAASSHCATSYSRVSPCFGRIGDRRLPKGAAERPSAEIEKSLQRCTAN